MTRAALLLLAAVLAHDATAAETLSVVPYGRYVLSFEAELASENTIENNPWYMNLYRFDAWTRGHRGRSVPCWELTFRNAEGTVVKNGKNFTQTFTCILHGGRRTYCEEFIAPPAAVTVTFSTSAPAAATLAVGPVSLQKVENAETLNVNPAFELGPHNLSGWNRVSNGYVLPDPTRPGKCRLTAGDDLASGSALSDWIPVTPEQRLRLDYRFAAVSAKRSGRVLVMTYADTSLRDDTQTGQLSKIFLLTSTNMTEGVYSFAVPSGITVLRLRAENAAVERLAVKEGWEE